MDINKPLVTYTIGLNRDTDILKIERLEVKLMEIFDIVFIAHDQFELKISLKHILNDKDEDLLISLINTTII